MRKKPKKLKRKLKTKEKKLKTLGKNSMSRRIAPLLTYQVMLKKMPDVCMHISVAQNKEYLYCYIQCELYLAQVT